MLVIFLDRSSIIFKQPKLAVQFKVYVHLNLSKELVKTNIQINLS